MYISGLVCSFLLLGCAAWVDPAPSGMYDAILRHAHHEYAGKPLVLYSTLVKIECIRGGCPEPWAGELPADWLEKVRTRKLITEYCAYRSGYYCFRDDGEKAVPTGSVMLMLSSERSCGAGCVEVFGHSVEPTGERSARQWWTLYTLTLKRGRWTLQQAQRVASGYLDS